MGTIKLLQMNFKKLLKHDEKRLIINMPPRHTKSEFASYLFPAWMIGRNPKMKIMQVSHNAELASRFGSKVRNLMNTKTINKSLEMLHSEKIVRLKDVGRPIMVENILQRG